MVCPWCNEPVIDITCSWDKERVYLCGTPECENYDKSFTWADILVRRRSVLQTEYHVTTREQLERVTQGRKSRPHLEIETTPAQTADAFHAGCPFCGDQGEEMTSPSDQRRQYACTNADCMGPVRWWEGAE